MVRKATDQDELAGRVAQVTTTINLNLVKESDWTTSAAAPTNVAEGLLEGPAAGCSGRLRRPTLAACLSGRLPRPVAAACIGGGQIRVGPVESVRAGCGGPGVFEHGGVRVDGSPLSG